MPGEEQLTGLPADLPRKTDGEVSRAIHEGRALSRSDSKLHLAVPSGVLSIPISNIESVTPISARDDSLVRVEVSAAHEVEHVVRVAPPSTGNTRPLRPPVGIGDERMDAADVIVDTATITAGKPDATDDAIDIVIIVF